MLELIRTQKNNESNLQISAIGESQSHAFINELIAQIKYTHLQEVWDQQLKNLSDIIYHADKVKHLKAL